MTQDQPHPSKARAVASGCIAYLIWGAVGYFFAYVTSFVSAPTLLAHRVVWSLAFVLLLLAIRRDLPKLRAALSSGHMVGMLSITSILVAINWLVFIYAASWGKLVDASLGYFLTPIMNVLLGVFVLHERLRRGQTLAIAFATVGVLLMLYYRAQTIWIPITLMLTWSVYGLLRKKIVIESIVGLGVETTLLLPIALLWVGYAHTLGGEPLAIRTYPLLIAAGIITATPLMLFAFAARRLQMTTIGLMQYIGPTVQFIIATVIMNENVTRQQYIAFAFIWLGLIVFSVDGLRLARAQRTARLSHDA
jgi:chloramphenicol-sensitive protein RarD